MIREQIVWVTFEYKDHSRRHVRTTLNPGLLRKYGVSPRHDSLFDFDKFEWVALSDDVKEVVWAAEKPDYEEELYAFTSRFI